MFFSKKYWSSAFFCGYPRYANAIRCGNRAVCSMKTPVCSKTVDAIMRARERPPRSVPGFGAAQLSRELQVLTLHPRLDNIVAPWEAILRFWLPF